MELSDKIQFDSFDILDNHRTFGEFLIHQYKNEAHFMATLSLFAIVYRSDWVEFLSKLSINSKSILLSWMTPYITYAARSYLLAKWEL